MLKQMFRKSGKATLKWLRDGDDNGGRRKVSGEPPVEYSYQWLNHVLFPKILAKGGKTLRPHYTWGVMQGMNLARALGIKRVSIMEFGVAGGNGLVSLEAIVETLEPHFGVQVDIYGFDSGCGLPKPEDYRDVPNVYSEGQYKMDIEQLRKRLKKSQLVLGLVENTIMEFIQRCPSPVAFMSQDLDYYTATIHALKILDATPDLLLPRVWCYFDDIMGPTKCDYTGERLAISDFNSSHEMRKISPIYGLQYALPQRYSKEIWSRKFFMAHIFDHEHYGRFDGLTPAPNRELTEP